MYELKKLRKSKGFTQEEASAFLGVSLRTYKTYENDETKIGTVKYEYMMDRLEKYVPLDEEHGILTIEEIKKVCKSVLSEYSVKYCILFGSYAKGTATEKSDVDLLVSTDVTGLRFFGIAERLRSSLHKKIDLLDLKQLTTNSDLLDEILKDGIRVYEQHEKWHYYLEKILVDLHFIASHMKGVTIDALSKNEILLDSMSFRLIQVQENARKLSDEYKNAHKSIPWTDIAGLRNRIVHDYGNVDLNIVFSTLTEDVPWLISHLENL